MAAMKALAVSERERGQGFSWMCCLVLCSRWCGMVSLSANPYLCSLLGFRARREREGLCDFVVRCLHCPLSLYIRPDTLFKYLGFYSERKVAVSLSISALCFLILGCRETS